MPIDFTLSPEQAALQQAAREFSAQVLTKVKPAFAGLTRPEERFFATRPFYKELVKAGFAAALIPKAYGGGGATALDFAIAGEEFTTVDVNVPSTLLASGLGLQPLLRFGSEEQKQRFLPDFVSTETDHLASLAFTEAAGGANYDCPDPTAGVQTVARRDGDEWVISGKKSYTTNGSGWEGKGAHLYSVLCRTDLGKPPQESLAWILVPGSTPGIEVTGYIDTLGHSALSEPHVSFNEARVPAANLIGKPGDGDMICQRAFAWTGAIIGAACTGVLRAAFDYAYQFAKTEKRSGAVPIIEHPTVGYQLVDLKTRVETSRYLAWKACHYLDSTDYRGEEISVMAKIHCSESCVQGVYDAMRIVGIDSYTDKTPLASLMKDALCFPLYDGGNMGVRRRWLYDLLKTPGYDPLAAAQGIAPAS